jgi:predicted polyphosphate/ATP-dependent NAD kinase
MKSIGLIINPIAGMGGRVGLKGTDGLAEQARALGALPLSEKKSARALARLPAGTRIITPPGAMGEACAVQAGLSPEILSMPTGQTPSAAQTIQAAEEMKNIGVGLILFAGGDGTARDIYSAVGEETRVLGIPAGVKIHSPVFAQSPEKAGELVCRFLSGKAHKFTQKEVLDIDEEAYRSGRVTTRLFGYLTIPEDNHTQSRKSGSPLSQKAAQNLIALDIIDRMQADVIYLIGPGSTTHPIFDTLSLPGSLLGVDILKNRKLVQKDASESDILNAIKNHPFKIVITPIGGQGYLFGRGNHQISPHVIRQAGKANILIAATLEKIGSLQGRPFLMDTGDPDVDRSLSGYIRVITGYRQEVVCKIE